MSEKAPIGAVPPPATLLQMMTGYWVSQALYVVAKLNVADLLADGPRPVEELAAATQSNALSLRRVLRALASAGVFTEASPGNFALTPLAALLRTGTSDSMRALAIMYAEEQYRAWGDILHSVKTGEIAFERQFGTSYFAYLAEHPEADRVFNEAMTGWTTQLVGAVVAAYDFSPFKTVVDVGGSYGTLLTAILRSNPAARGILFDQPTWSRPPGRTSWRPGWRSVARSLAATSSPKSRPARTHTCSPRSCTTGTMSAAWLSSGSADGRCSRTGSCW